MKFKNSYTLLIAIAVLLISIGSVCASENITADSDNLLADTDETVVLESENTESISATGNITTNVDTSQNEYSFNENEKIIIPTTVKDNESNEIAVTSADLSVYEDTNQIGFDYLNNEITILDTLSAGKHSLIINYLGDDTYANSSKTVSVEINNDTTPTNDTFDIDLNNVTSINVNSTKKGEIKFKIFGDVDFDSLTKTVTITYKDGDKTETIIPKSLNIANGVISFEFDELNFKTATLTMQFNNVSKNVTLNRVYNYKLNPKTTSADYEDGSFTFEVVDADDNTILANKAISITLKENKENGTNLYFISSQGTSISMNSSATLTSDANGIVTLVNKGFYPSIALLEEYYAPVGSYIVVGGSSGNTKGTNNVTITINKIDVKLELLKFSEKYQTKKNVTLKVTNAKTGKVLAGVYVVLNITNASLSNAMQMTNGKGLIQLGVSKLPAGTYKMTFVTNDTSLNNKSGSGSFTIKKATVKIKAKNVKILYNSGKKTYTIKVTKGGEPLNNTYITVKLYTTSKKYIKFNAATNEKGKFSFTASLNKGKHKIIISNKIDPRYKAKTVKKTITVKKASGKFQAKNLKAKSNSKKKFTIKLINKKNKKPIFNAKVNIKLYLFNTNKYYNFNGNTGSNGVIKLSLKNLQRGKYNVYISGNDKKNYNAKTLKKLLVIK